MQKDAFTYFLASRRYGALYLGVTSDLIRRVFEHKTNAISGHTSRYNIKTLVWFETHGDITQAIKREKRLKKYPRQWKINLIEKENRDWRDLYMEICR